MSWVEIENAMQQAVVEGSRLSADRVYWSYQDRNEGTGTFIVITFGGETQLGQDWVTSTTDLSRQNGQEILQQVHGVREVPFQIECFTDDTSGETAARRLAELVRTRFRLPSVRYRVRRAGVGLFDSSPVLWIPDVLAAKFRGRALVTMRCYVPVMDCFEYVGYIARVRGTFYPVGWHGVSGSSGVAFDSDNSP